MNRLTRILNFRFPALAACLLFFVTGSAFVSHLGIQNDEALFANGIFKPYAVAYTLHLGRSSLPLMLMSYLGTLKSWIYRPIFQLFGAGVSAMRVPMLLAGVASVWLFYLLLRRVAGQRAALFGCGLLAADSLCLLFSAPVSTGVDSPCNTPCLLGLLPSAQSPPARLGVLPPGPGDVG